MISKDQQKFGDRIANTIIFYSGNKRNRLVKVLFSIGIFTLFISVTVMATIILLKNDKSYKISIDFIQSSRDIHSQVGDIVGFGLFPMGGVSITNGKGEAHFDINVKGTLRTVSVNIYPMFIQSGKDPHFYKWDF